MMKNDIKFDRLLKGGDSDRFIARMGIETYNTIKPLLKGLNLFVRGRNENRKALAGANVKTEYSCGYVRSKHDSLRQSIRIGDATWVSLYVRNDRELGKVEQVRRILKLHLY